MVDKTVLAARIAAIRDAVDRIRAFLPETVDRFAADRTSREVIVLNLFVARQESVPLAVHARNSFLTTDYIDLNPDLVV